jgi:putative addiction module killer protein
MYKVLRSTRFDEWIRKLRDPIGKARILARLRSAIEGNLGDCKPVGRGVLEMRIQTGPGYRIYFLRQGSKLIVLLCAGDKSTQREDIDRAQRMSAEWTESDE